MKKDIELEKAGLQFISYQELQATVCERSSNDHSSDHNEDADLLRNLERTEDETTAEGGMGPGSDDEQQEEEEVSHLVENIRVSDPRRGTEVKLLGLSLGENTATVVAHQITVCLQCNRQVVKLNVIFI